MKLREVDRNKKLSLTQVLDAVDEAFDEDFMMYTDDFGTYSEDALREIIDTLEKNLVRSIEKQIIENGN